MGLHAPYSAHLPTSARWAYLCPEADERRGHHHDEHRGYQLPHHLAADRTASPRPRRRHPLTAAALLEWWRCARTPAPRGGSNHGHRVDPAEPRLPFYTLLRTFGLGRLRCRGGVPGRSGATDGLTRSPGPHCSLVIRPAGGAGNRRRPPTTSRRLPRSVTPITTSSRRASRATPAGSTSGRPGPRGTGRCRAARPGRTPTASSARLRR